MPTSTGTGTVTFREVSATPGVNFDGSDSLTIKLRGHSSLFAAEMASWDRYDTYSGYPNMFLTSKVGIDRGPVSEITLTFTGYIDSDTPNNGLVSKTNGNSEQSVQLTSDEDENVAFRYYGQVTTYRWMSRGSQEPSSPRFSIAVPTDIPAGYLFGASPPNYTGSISSSYTVEARVSQFLVTQITPTLFSVDETWELKVLPV